MKIYIKPLIGVLFCLFSNQVISASVNLNINDSYIEVGEQFTIDVSVSDVNDLIAFGFDETHDSSWTLNNISVASPFNDDSAFFPDTEVAGSVFPGLTGGNVLLASLDFIASTEGIFIFEILSDLSDFNEGGIEFGSPNIIPFNNAIFAAINGTFDLTSSLPVTINPANVSEPPVVALLLIGYFVRRKSIRSKCRIK